MCVVIESQHSHSGTWSVSAKCSVIQWDILKHSKVQGDSMGHPKA